MKLITFPLMTEHRDKPTERSDRGLNREKYKHIPTEGIRKVGIKYVNQVWVVSLIGMRQPRKIELKGRCYCIWFLCRYFPGCRLHRRLCAQLRSSMAPKPVLNVLRLSGVSIYRQLQLEELLLRYDNRNWFIVNEGNRIPTIVLGISGKPQQLGKIHCVQHFDVTNSKLFVMHYSECYSSRKG